MSRALESFAQIVSTMPSKASEGRDGSLDRMIRLARAAHIYEFDGSLVQNAIEGANRLNEAEAIRANLDPVELSKRFENLTKDQPFPYTPFPVMFVGFDRDVHPGNAYMDYESSMLPIDWKSNCGVSCGSPHDLQVSALGMLVAETDSDNGIVCWLFRQSAMSIGLYEGINMILVHSPNDGWTPLGQATGLWAVSIGIIKALRESRLIKRDVTAGTRHIWQKAGVQGLRPQPYYKVDLSRYSATHSVRTNTEEELRRALTFRHDRSGHDRLFLHRGIGPISDAQVDRLASLGYSVWINSDPDESVASLMAARGHKPKAAGEWVATKVVWIEPTVVGSPELPYVPAVRIG